MAQLKMMKNGTDVLDYPLHEAYYIRNIIPGRREEMLAWANACKDGQIGIREGDSEEEWLALYKRCIPDTPGLSEGTDVFFVCDKATDKVVATLTAHILENGDGNIHMVSALEEVRGKKIGHAMLSRGLKRLAADGVSRVWLRTDDFRLPAIKNYLTAGFRPVIYEPDMPERWNKVLDNMGIPDRHFVNPDGTEWQDA